MTYKGPGAYVKEVALPQPVALLGSARVVGIAGKGSSNYQVANVEITKGVAAGVDSLGLDTGDLGVVIGVGSLPGLYDYVLGTDYVVTGETIDWSPGGSEPTVGVIYYVTYKRDKSTTYYAPTLYYIIDDVRSAYGSELDNGFISEITLAAKLAFQNGASQVLCVQQVNSTVTEQQNAIDKLEAEDLDILSAPGMTSTTMQAYILSHVNKMSSETMKKERIFLTSGLALTSSVANLKVRAAAFNNELVTVMAPAVCKITLKDSTLETEASTEVSGQYLGAALAGIMANPNYDEAEPLTRKILTGIDSLQTSPYKESEMNDLASNGITVVGSKGGVLRIRHAVTTNTANVNKIELQVVSIKNQVKKDIRTLLDSYIGSKYVTANTNALLVAAVKSFCEQKIDDSVFVESRNIRVAQDSADGRKAVIHFEFKPVYTLTWIDITFGLYTV